MDQVGVGLEIPTLRLFHPQTYGQKDQRPLLHHNSPQIQRKLDARGDLHGHVSNQADLLHANCEPPCGTARGAS